MVWKCYYFNLCVNTAHKSWINEWNTKIYIQKYFLLRKKMKGEKVHPVSIRKSVLWQKKKSSQWTVSHRMWRKHKHSYRDCWCLSALEWLHLFLDEWIHENVLYCTLVQKKAIRDVQANKDENSVDMLKYTRTFWAYIAARNLRAMWRLKYSLRRRHMTISQSCPCENPFGMKAESSSCDLNVTIWHHGHSLSKSRWTGLNAEEQGCSLLSSLAHPHRWSHHHLPTSHRAFHIPSGHDI